MGNHHSHLAPERGPHGTERPDNPTNSSGSVLSAGSKPEKSLSRSASGADIQDKFSSQFSTVDKLAKILVKRSQEEDGVQGISEGVFSRHVFPRYPILAEKLFKHYHSFARSKTAHLSSTAFKLQTERFLGILDDEAIRTTYVKMYCETTEANVTETMDQESLRLLLMTAYRVAMDHYSEGPQMCLHIQKTLTAIVDSCFHGKIRLSSQYITNWLTTHCPRLLLPLHRYTVHCLATAHRYLATEEASLAAGLDLATPVLEQPPPFSQGKSWTTHLLPMSFAWVLAGALPPLYSRPQTPLISPSGSGGGLSSHAFLSKLVAAVPSHWLPLYNSDCHGQGANRFLHHVLGYRGPTLCLLKADCGSVFCIASPSEWHESHLYWGGDDCAILQMTPKFILVEKGPKLLYLNTTIRGYPHGLRAGKDPRKPIIIVDSGFEKIEYHNIPYGLSSIEVWGCGDQTQRETQLDIKKWQVREAERQRTIKLSAADWLDHPDRYLLELAGRPQYHSKQSQPQ